MASAHSYRRKHYLVDRGYQLRFATRLFAVVFAIAVASALIAAGLLWKHVYLRSPEANTPLLVASLVAVAATLLIELLLAIPLIFLLGIQQTYRMVGPLTRIKQVLTAIGAGDFRQRLAVRRGDALEDLARVINKTAGRLEERFPHARQE
jgi:methyl-accepting chemotaxis protein